MGFSLSLRLLKLHFLLFLSYKLHPLKDLFMSNIWWKWIEREGSRYEASSDLWVEIVGMQRLTLGEWGCPLDYDPKLAVKQPNRSWKKEVKIFKIWCFGKLTPILIWFWIVKPKLYVMKIWTFGNQEIIIRNWYSGTFKS